MFFECLVMDGGGSVENGFCILHNIVILYTNFENITNFELDAFNYPQVEKLCKVEKKISMK